MQKLKLERITWLIFCDRRRALLAYSALVALCFVRLSFSLFILWGCTSKTSEIINLSDPPSRVFEKVFISLYTFKKKKKEYWNVIKIRACILLPPLTASHISLVTSRLAKTKSAASSRLCKPSTPGLGFSAPDLGSAVRKWAPVSLFYGT